MFFSQNIKYSPKKKITKKTKHVKLKKKKASTVVVVVSGSTVVVVWEMVLVEIGVGVNKSSVASIVVEDVNSYFDIHLHENTSKKNQTQNKLHADTIESVYKHA